ncbi:MAG: magnesium transporter CorA [Haliscomenobacteraceae bacterium CHB4]|nr:magnesium transporter CorA [Haliscomenobacteraceae bacterium CHB4]
MVEQWHPKGQENFEWIDVAKPATEELSSLAQQYNLHPHTVADCLEPDHLPKFEMTDKTGFVITRKYAPKDEYADTIQELSSKVALFFSDGFLISIHRLPQPFLSDINARYVSKGFCRNVPALVLRIVEGVLQSYVKPGEALSDEIDRYESLIFLKKNIPDLQENIYYIKRKAGVTKKIIKLTEEVIVLLEKQYGPSPELEELWDMYTKVETLYDQIYDDAHALTNVYLAISAQRTNEVMRILTIFSVFFMPLTFIVGIYGMNFDWMPELRVWWGYPAVLCVMVVIIALIFAWFRWRKWL